MKTLLPALLIALSLAVAACATSKTGGPRTRSDLITQEEIAGTGLVFKDAYDIVRQFRPQWLIKRGNVNLTTGQGTQMLDYIVIYEDGTRRGDPEILRTIPAQSVLEIQHYSPAQAQRLGPLGHPHGAILVRTKSG